MKNHSFAVTAVGIAHGTRMAARTSPRPRNVRFMMSAIHSPNTVSSTTVTAVKKKVTKVAFQNCAPRLPGGQAMGWPDGPAHCCRSQWR
jgi:hypothetical protein